MPTLEWIGKSKVINHHQDVPFRVLERKYSFDENGQHSEDNGSENMIIWGDNLEALKALLPRYEGRVKCIYIDPPYNTGNEGWVYNDNVNDPKIKKWLGEVVGKVRRRLDSSCSVMFAISSAWSLLLEARFCCFFSCRAKVGFQKYHWSKAEKVSCRTNIHSSTLFHRLFFAFQQENP